MTILQKYQKMAHYIMIKNSRIVIKRIINKVIMTQQETRGMIPILEDSIMMTLMDLMIIMIRIKLT